MSSNWKKDFKDKMQDYQEIAPEGLWSELSSVMDIKPATKPIFPIFLKYASIAAAAAIGVGVYFYAVNNDEFSNYDYYISDSKLDNNVRDNADDDSLIKIIPAEKITYTSIEEKNHSPRQKQPNPAPLSQESINTPLTTDNPQNKAVNTNMSESGGNGRENSKKIDSTYSDGFSGYNDFPEYVEETNTPEHRKITIGAYIAGTIGNINTQSGYLTSTGITDIRAFGSDPGSDIRLFNRNKDVSSSTKYIQPVKVGIHFKGYITKRLSIGTGIEWTWLHSSLKEGSNSYYSTATKDMHYIGIPLNLNYDIWQGRHLNVYATVGGTLEKCIYGINSVQYVFNHSTAKSEISKITEKQLQWSVTAGIGVEYNFSKFAGIYASPGISWHFDNNSGINNIYKARPLNFAMSLGFRFYL